MAPDPISPKKGEIPTLLLQFDFDSTAEISLLQQSLKKTRDMVCTGRLLLLYWGFEAIFFWKNWSFKGSLRILPHETLPIWLEAVSTEERWESPNKLFPSMNVKVLTTKPLTLGRSWHLFTLPPFKFTRFCCVINNLVPKKLPKSCLNFVINEILL